jgi:hypothetical protein
MRPFLAVLLTLASACGQPVSGRDAQADPGRSDAGLEAADAAVADAFSGEPGPVSITVAMGGALAEGLPVVFQNADESLVSVEHTDADGQATAIMAPGGSLTVIYSQPGHDSVLSILGVEPGDELNWGTPDGVFEAEVEVSLPASDGDSPEYWVRSRCGGAYPFPTEPLARLRRIPGCTQADVFVGVQQKNLPFSDYGAFVARNVNLDADSVDLSAQHYAAARSVDVTLLNTPSTIGAVHTKLAVTTPPLGLWAHSSATTSITYYREGPKTPMAQDVAFVPDIGATSLLAETTVHWKNSIDRTSIIRVAERVDFTTDYQLDVSSLSMPAMKERATLQDSGELAWSEEGGGSADWLQGTYRVRREGVVLDRIVWAPHSGPSVKPPSLPGEFADLDARPDDEPEIIWVRLGKGPGGYRAYRRFNKSRGIFEQSLSGPGERIFWSSTTSF